MALEGAALGVGSPAARRWRLDEERLRVYSWLIVAIFAVVYLGWILASMPRLIDPSGEPLGFDFMAFWSAARLAAEGRAAAAYDWIAMAATHRVAVPELGNKIFLWHYPPSFLLVLLPLGFLPYAAALALFNGATLGLWAALSRALLPERGLWIAGLALPAGLINLLHGQNGFLTAVLAGFALLALPARPVLAGLLIGLLAIKPHLALLFPVALLATRQWRAVAAAAVTALALSLASLAVFGWGTWLAFVHDLPFARHLVDVQFLPWARMPSPYVFALSVGIPAEAAMALQAVVAVAAAGCVYAVWRRPAASFETKAAVLVIASLLVSPYLFYYDLTWAGLAIAWLGLQGVRQGFLHGERLLLFAAWIMPLLLDPLHALTGLSLGFPLLLALLALALRHARVDPAPGIAR